MMPACNDYRPDPDHGDDEHPAPCRWCSRPAMAHRHYVWPARRGDPAADRRLRHQRAVSTSDACEDEREIDRISHATTDQEH